MVAPRSSFSTADFAARDRFDAWYSRPFPNLPALFETGPPPSDFEAHASTISFGDVSITRSWMSGLSYDRTAAQIRRDSLDHLGVLLLLDGAQHGDADGRSVTGTSGAIIFGDMARPNRFRNPDAHAVTLMFPRAVAESILPPIDRLHGLTIDASNARLLVDSIRAMLPHAERLGVDAGPALARSMLHMLALTMGGVARHDPERSEIGTALRRLAFERVNATIAARCGDPAFGIGELGRRVGMSRSSLYRLLEESGGVAAAIRRARVGRLRSLIADFTDQRRLSEKCFAAGFGDQTGAIRAFRSVEGMTPRDYLAICATGLVQKGDKFQSTD